VVSFGVAIILLVASVATGTFSLGLAPAAWGAIAGLAILSTGLAFIAFLRGLAVLGPVRTAIVSTIEPFWTALLGALVLSQPLSSRAAVGGALIAAAVILLQRAAARRAGAGA
jgi:drug/metabolite transporter (DMT)-like permease